VLGELKRHEVWKRYCATASLGLRSPVDQSPASLGDLLLDADAIPHEVETIDAEPDEFRQAQR
jgi:hypothetical protein